MSRAAPEPLTEAQRDLAARNLGLAYGQAASFGRRYPSHGDDYLGAALLGLTRAARRYDPSRGFAFTTYAHRAIRTELVGEWSRMMRRGISAHIKTQVDVRVVDVPQFSFEELPAPNAEPDRPLLEAEEPARVERLLSELPPRSAGILRARMDGRTLREIGLELGLTRERVRQLEKQAHRDLRPLTA